MILVTIKDVYTGSVNDDLEDWHFPFYSENEAKAFRNMLLNDEGLDGLEEDQIIFSDIDVRQPKYNAAFQFDRFYKMIRETY